MNNKYIIECMIEGIGSFIETLCFFSVFRYTVALFSTTTPKSSSKTTMNLKKGRRRRRE